MTKILYVEDNEDNIYMFKLRFEKKGYKVLVAKDGQEGIDAAKTERPDIIIMDVGMPELDGYEATKILKADKDLKNIPIIILTAHALVSDAEKAEAAGADDFETKPLNAERLTEKITKLTS